METSLLANFYQLINCCNILCVTEYVTMYFYFISGYYNTEYAWSNYTYLSSCTYMQIRRVDLSYVSGLPTFHMLPTPLLLHFTTLLGWLIASEAGMVCYVHYNREISTACFNV